MTIPSTAHPSAAIFKAFNDGQLDPTEVEAIRAHLGVCPQCQALSRKFPPDSLLGSLRMDQLSGSTPSPSSQVGDTDRHGDKTSERAIEASTVLPELQNHPQYEVLRELDRGGMGIVYLAKHRLSKRTEVLKVVNPQVLAEPGMKERFLREIEMACRLDHKNVVRAITAFEVENLLVLVMDYAEGDNLQKVVTESPGPLAVVTACDYARQVAMGLQHAFNLGMVHRDIKPKNLIRTITPEKHHLIRILDFGLAKAVSDQEATRHDLTATGEMMGTPNYFAPEQAMDAARADIRADIYSLGCTLYFLLAGRPPFQAPSVYALVAAHTSQAITPLNEVRPDVPVELAAVVAKMMAKTPDQRYQTPGEVITALDPFVKTVPNSRSSLPPRTKKPRVGMAAIILGAMGLLLVVSCAVGIYWTLSNGSTAVATRSSDAFAEGTTAPQTMRGFPPSEMSTELSTEPRKMPGTDNPKDTGRISPPNTGQDGPKTTDPLVAKVKSVSGVELVLIPNGSFYMGSPADDKDADDDEKPQHKVTISKPYYMGKYKVTVGQFNRFVEATGYKTGAEKDSDRRTWKNPGFDQTAEHPVVCVDWTDADAYCQWLAKETGATVRLPSEAKREYSCRAKTTTKFYFGDNEADLGDYAWYTKNTNDKGTQPCGQKKPNAFGLYDMHGLAWEWCADGKRKYEDREETDPLGPTTAGASRVIRGGSFYSNPGGCRAAVRYDNAPSIRYDTFGFRVAVSR